MKLTYHEFSELLPKMTADELAGLRADIESNKKLKDPIVLFEGKILDGRNRYEALEDEKEGINATRQKDRKIPVKTVVFPGTRDEALASVLSSAIRRNLKTEQKIFAAVNFHPYVAAQAKARQSAAGGALPEKLPEAVKGESADIAGKLFGVCGKSVRDGIKVKDASKKMFRLMGEGVKTLAQAKREIHRKAGRKQLLAKAALAPTTGDAAIITGDCIRELEKVPARSFRLGFADPFYNIGYSYLAGEGRDGDRMPPEKYLAFTEQWIEEAHRVLTDDGALWVLICDEWAIDYGLILRKRFTIRAWVKPYESFGMCRQNNFARTSRHLFHCVKDAGNCVFHAREAFTERSKRQTVYGDKRAAAGGKIWDDVWDIPRLQDGNPERIKGMPTQLPLALVRPIVLGCSDPGDTVFDPFTGSGTTAVASVENGRKFWGTEKKDKYARRARLRVRAALAECKA